MSIEATDLRDFAAGLAVSDSSEVQLRAACSRAYYAAYHALLPLAERLPQSDGYDPSSVYIGHRELLRRIREWKTSGLHPDLAGMTMTKKQIAIALEASRKCREIVDYQLGEAVSLNETKAQVERVRKILRSAKQIYDMLEKKSEAA